MRKIARIIGFAVAMVALLAVLHLAHWAFCLQSSKSRTQRPKEADEYRSQRQTRWSVDKQRRRVRSQALWSASRNRLQGHLPNRSR
jgi:hypothetical protein